MAEAQRGAIEAAADVLKVALGEDQTNARFLYWLGMCLAAMGKYNFSTQAYEAAIEEDPLYVYVHENQGFAFGQADKSPGCPCMDYLASVRGTGEAQSLEGRAIEHFNHGRFYFGLRELKAAVRFDPDNPRIHNRMAVAYFDAFQWEEAEQEIRLALAAFPGFSRSHALLALLAEERGDTALARRQWEKHLIFCAQPRWKTKALDRLQRLAFGRAGQPAPRILKADVKPPRVQALSAGSRKSRMAHREVL
jgi:tetratricopeptide (TPR) repeat protein